MTKGGFTPEMLELLRSMKGKVFKSYECVLGSGRSGGSIYGEFRINLGRSSIEVNCEHCVADYDGVEEEFGFFSCKEVDQASGLYDEYEDPPQTVSYLVDEIIAGVEVLRDKVIYADSGFMLEMDMALVIRTKHHTFIFSHTLYDSVLIAVDVYESGHPAETYDSIDELWFDDQPEDHIVTRTVEVL